MKEFQGFTTPLKGFIAGATLACVFSSGITGAFAFNKTAIEDMREKLKKSNEVKLTEERTKKAAPETAPDSAAVKTKPEVPAILAPTNASDAIISTGEIKLAGEVKETAATNENGLTLVESINKALESNRDLKAAEKNINLADVKVREARSGYEPKLNIQGVLTRLDQPSTVNFGGMSIVMSDKVVQDHKITYSQPVYTCNRVEYGKAMAEKYKDAAVFSVDSAKVNLVYNVRKSFYDLLLAKEFVKVATESLELIKAHVQTVKNRFNAGTSSKFDLLRVEVQEANIKPNLIKAVHGLTISKNVFNNVLAMPIFYEIEIRGKLYKPELPVVDLDNAINTALAGRQDVMAAKSDLDAAEYALKLAKAGNKPTVALAGTYEKALGSATPIDKFNETWNMSMVAQMPLYDGKATKHSVETAHENIGQKTIRFEQILENVKLEVKIAHQELIQADELIVASEKNVEQAREALSIAQVSYDNGLNTNLEIMDAQLALTQAKTNYYQSLHDYMVAYAKLEKAMGIARMAE
ncbi:MAG TPA: TolC family protein [Candidatus Wallbacteria bacterium]|nr:TolC family protein [Candidatus Wallbacteria bacterium]